MKITLLLSVFVCISLFSANIPTSQKDIELLKEALLIVKSSYVKANLNDQDLIHGAIEGIVTTLDDPYTNFLTPEEFRELNDETRGRFGGVGIIVTLRDQKVTVISPIYDSPADRAGIRAGDIISAVNNEQINDGELKKTLKLLQGNTGESVEIQIYRAQDSKFRTFQLTREVIKNSSIIYSGITDENYGYIRIRNFSASTEQDLSKEISSMEELPIKGLVLDLRSNAGGLLSSGINVANLFLSSGTILSTRSRDGDKHVYLADSKVSHCSFPMVILIDQGTASAAEIVSAALHDNGRALLVGEKSFGKGCVQTVKELSDGSALSLTTAWYYTPSGKCIHGQGIDPDISVLNPELSDEENEKLAGKVQKDQETSYQDRYAGKLHKFSVPQYDQQLIRGLEALSEFWKFKTQYEKLLPAAN